MTEKYNIDPVHEAVGESYTMAKDVQNPDMRESMVSGVVKLARQTRAAEEFQDTGLFEAAEAMEYGSEGMGDIYVARGAAHEQAKGYREAFAEMMSGEGNPLQAAAVVEKQAEQSLQGAEKGIKPSRGIEQLGNKVGQLKELQEHLEYGSQAQRDAVRGDQIAEEAAMAYGTSLGALINEEEALERRHESNLREEDEDTKLAAIAFQELNPQSSQ